MGYANYSDTENNSQSSNSTPSDVTSLNSTAETARLTVIRGVLAMTDDEIVSFQQRFFQVEG